MSKKTAAAIAAEQQPPVVEDPAAVQEAEPLPAATLEQLEEYDLGTVVEDERPPFRITDDRSARSPRSAASTSASRRWPTSRSAASTSASRPPSAGATTAPPS